MIFGDPPTTNNSKQQPRTEIQGVQGGHGPLKYFSVISALFL